MTQTHRSFFQNLFGVRRSIRYHERRQSFFETSETLCTWAQITCGTTGLGTLIAKEGVLGASLLAVMLAGLALNRAAKLGQKAERHSNFRQQFVELESAMLAYEGQRDITERKELEFRKLRRKIEGREPTKLRVVDVLAHNDLVASNIDYQGQPPYPVHRRERWLGHFMDIEIKPIQDRHELLLG